MCTRSSRDNWERLVAAVIKKEQIWQLCHQDSITTVDSDFSERDLSLRSGPSSPSHQLLTRNSVIDEVRKDGSGSTKRFSALFWRKKPKEYGMAGFISVADSDTFSAESSTTLSTKNSPVFLYDGTLLEMGTYLSTPKTKKLSEDGENNRLRYGLSSMQGWRATMEDAHAAITDLDASTSFFGVYDGHGGKAVAKFCAKYLHQQVLKQEAYTSGDIGTSVWKSFFRMDEMMRGQRGWRELAVLGDKINKFTGMIEGLIWSPRSGDKSDRVDDWAFEEGPHSDFSGPTSGCTACAAIIRENQLLVANAGDSRCVISRNGQAYNLSRDHKPDLEVERDRILKAGGFIHAGRVNGSLNLARAIGDMEFKQNKFLPPEKQIVTASPDVNIVELCDDDEFIVLACDGIWDCMSSQQLVDFIREQLKSETKLSAVCEKVLDRCLAPSTAGGQGCDNMTMILVQFMKPTHSASSSDNKSSASEEVPAEPNNAAESE